MNRQLLQIIKNNNFNLIFLAKTETVYYKVTSKFKKYSKTYYYFMDPLKTALEENAHKHAALTDWSSASTMIVNQFFKKHGAKSYLITQGFNSDLFSPDKENKNKKIDVIFVGTANDKRRQYIDFLRKNNINVICFGIFWPTGPIYLEELVKKYRQSKIILNLLQWETGFSIRIFQAMGTGSLLLSQNCPDLGKIFKKGKQLDWFNTPEECLELIRYYLKEEEKREEIAKEGCNFVHNNYSWEKIMEKVIDITKINMKN